MNEPTILLVEDDLNDQELIRLSLAESSLKHELIVMNDGEDALDYILGRGKYDAVARSKPMLVLLDLKLPRVTGHEVLRELRRHSSTKDVPVVIFTSSKEEKDIRESYDLGANAFVRKPIEYTEFSETIKTIGVFWLKLNQSAYEF